MLIFARRAVVDTGLIFLAFSSYPVFAQQSNNVSLAPQDPAANLITERERSDIYAKLKCCACNVSFDKCTCAESKEMKAYIEALLESGSTKEDVFYKVAKKFSLNLVLDERIKSDLKERLIKEAGQIRPQIAVATERLNFGKVSKRQGKISKTLKLFNNGSSGLIITNIRVSCDCVSVSLEASGSKSPDFGVRGAEEGWKVSIAPGNFGVLVITLDLMHSSVPVGRMERDIFVASNDPVYPEVTIRVEAEVGD